MKDPRLTKLAHVLINYSTKLKEGEKVLIEGFDIPPELIIELRSEPAEEDHGPALGSLTVLVPNAQSKRLAKRGADFGRAVAGRPVDLRPAGSTLCGPAARGTSETSV